MLAVLLSTGALAAGGCVDPRVTVDTRLAADSQLWSKLDGPRYVVVADDPRVQATLAFEEYAQLWAQVLSRQRPELRRVATPGEADLVFTMNYSIVDLGTGISVYPVYGPTCPAYGEAQVHLASYHGWGYGIGHGHGYSHGWGGPFYGPYYGGQEVETYHLGYRHILSISAWVPDASRPAGRRVIWEGQAERTEDQASLKAAMPYLTAGLGQFYGQATSKPTTVKVHKDDLPGAAPVAASAPTVVSLESTSRPS
jgi:hypothetical protein